MNEPLWRPGTICAYHIDETVHVIKFLIVCNICVDCCKHQSTYEC